MVQNYDDEWRRTVPRNGVTVLMMVLNCAGEWCRTVLMNGVVELRNGAEQCLRMVQNSTDEWCSSTDEWCTTVLLLLEPVVLELNQRELRRSYGSWPVSDVRSLWKTQHTISDNHILELTLQQ